jgi:hypothetical protein
MVMQVYNPSTRLFTEQDGTEHRFFNGEAEFPEEAMTLIKFKQGELSLQEAYIVLLRLARDGIGRRESMEEKILKWKLSNVKQELADEKKRKLEHFRMYDLVRKELNELQEKINTRSLFRTRGDGLMNIDIYELAKQTSMHYPEVNQEYLYKVLQQIAWRGVIGKEELQQLNETILGGRE